MHGVHLLDLQKLLWGGGACCISALIWAIDREDLTKISDAMKRRLFFLLRHNASSDLYDQEPI